MEISSSKIKYVPIPKILHGKIVRYQPVYTGRDEVIANRLTPGVQGMQPLVDFAVAGKPRLAAPSLRERVQKVITKFIFNLDFLLDFEILSM